MMKKLTVVLTLWIVFAGTSLSAAEKIIPLPDLMKPGNIDVYDQYIYITENASIYIYSVKDFKLVKKFGKEGQGPQEFAIHPRLPLTISVTSGKLFVSSIGKLSQFTLDGNFIDEKRMPQLALFLIPCASNFIGLRFAAENSILYRYLTLFSPEAQKIKDIAKYEEDFQGPGKGLKLFQRAFGYQIMNDLIFTTSEKDFIIDVFDKQGKHLYAIKHDYKLLDCSNEDKKRIEKTIENMPEMKDIISILKPLKFADTYPAIFTFSARDNAIYVFTWKRDDKSNEVFILDPKGKILKKTTLPLQTLDGTRPVPFAINKGKFYQIIENEDDETWELHISDIK